MHVGTLMMLLMYPVGLAILLVGAALEVSKLLGELDRRPLSWGGGARSSRRRIRRGRGTCLWGRWCCWSRSWVTGRGGRMWCYMCINLNWQRCHSFRAFRGDIGAAEGIVVEPVSVGCRCGKDVTQDIRLLFCEGKRPLLPLCRPVLWFDDFWERVF